MLGERLAINSVVQGSAADLIKIAMNRVHVELIPEFNNTNLLLQIHDELLLETPQSNAEKVKSALVEIMESAMDLHVPLVADAAIGDNWAECK